MANVLNWFNNLFSTKEEGEYLEIETGAPGEKAKILVKPFVLREFDDVKYVLETLRNGYTIALVDVKHLRDKDVFELKRAVSKIKKTCDALEGDIAGFDNLIIVTPSFAKIYRGRGAAGSVEKVEERK
ncbi:MAG: cell division protein SepF [Nanoarchaeota archaeon]|nr:cell division protein SepF [Nanoarchaeota archaeon]